MVDETCPLGHGPMLQNHRLSDDLTKQRIKENWNKPNPFVNPTQTRLLPKTLDFPAYWSDFFDNDILFIKKLMSKRALGPFVHMRQYQCSESSCEWELTAVGLVNFDKWSHKIIPRYNPNDPESFDWVSKDELNPKPRVLRSPIFSRYDPDLLPYKELHDKHHLFLLSATYMAASMNYGYLNKFRSLDDESHYDLRTPSVLVNRINFRGGCPGGCLYPSPVYHDIVAASRFHGDMGHGLDNPVIRFLTNYLNKDDLQESVKAISSKDPLTDGHA